MIRLVACVGVVTLVGIAVTTAPVRPVAAGAGIALVLGVAGIVSLRRWAVTSSACLFVADYALAVRLAGGSIDVVGATACGLALLMVVQPLEIARSRDSGADIGVTRSQVVGWIVAGVAVPGVVVLAFGVSRALASSVPPLVAPLLAAAGAIGVLVGLASALARAPRDT
jgi:hypothetical protein